MRYPTHPLSLALVVFSMLVASSADAQLSAAWMVPAVANTQGVNGTFWRSDVSLHNPHEFDLPLVVQLLPSGTENWRVPTLDLTLYPWETVNLWDALGPDLFAHSGTGAMIVYADPALQCGDGSCEFLVTSRTYTVEPRGGDGEFGQTIPGFSIAQGMDWWTLGYAAGILNDGDLFRCNVGVASWTADWTEVRVDVQDAQGDIVAAEELLIPPYGHVQRRLATAVSGGSLVFYLVSGPDDSLLYPYASVANQETGDPSFAGAVASDVGVSIAKGRPQQTGGPTVPEALGDRLSLGGARRGGSRPTPQRTSAAR